MSSGIGSIGGGPISGLGRVPLWGHSPARDLIQLIPGGKESLENGSKEQPFRILLVGQADLRHVLQTVAKNKYLLESKSVEIHFYIAEDFPEVICRELLLLLLAIQPLSMIGLQEKSLQWLELFGNSLIRPKTRKTFLEITEKLIESVMNPDEKGLFDLSDLKFREKDDLVDIFKNWKSFGEVFPIRENWKKRMHQHLGQRYDVRQNIYDWDYSMRLIDRTPSASIISSAEYKKWRETGVAFADFDSEYSQPNVSLATGIAPGGGVFLSYQGEIVTGPFISFGIEGEDASLFEKVNGRHKSTSHDVSLHNLERIFKIIAGTEKPLSDLIKVTFLSPSMFGGPRFIKKFPEGFFDAGFFSTNAAQWVLPPIINLLKPNSPVVVEDTRFLLEVLTAQETVFRDKVLELAKKCELEFISPEDESPFLQFVKYSKGPSSETPAESGGDLIRVNSQSEDGTSSMVPPADASSPIDLDKESQVSIPQSPLGDTA